MKVGITDYAAKTLNDIVYLTLPSAGQELKQLSTFGTVESIKAVSELYSPLSGTVTSTNQELVNHPELINKSPYEAGWIIELKPSKLEEEKRALLCPEAIRGVPKVARRRATLAAQSNTSSAEIFTCRANAVNHIRKTLKWSENAVAQV